MSFLLTIIGGALYALGYPSVVLPFPIPLLPIIGIALWCYSTKILFENNSLVKLLVNSLCFSMGYYLMGYYWIPFTIREFGEIVFPFNYLVGSLSILILMPHLLIFSALYKFLQNKTTLIKAPVTIAFLLTCLEYFSPQLFPAHIGQSWQVLAPYLGLADILGAPAYSFVSYWLAINLVKLIHFKKIDYLLIPTLFIFCYLSFHLSYPNYKHNHRIENSKMLKVRLVQANIGNFLKLNSESGDIYSLTRVLDSYQTLSQNTSEEKADLIIWPETAYPKLLSTNFLYQGSTYTPSLFKNTIDKTQTPLFVGGYDQAQNSNPSFFETEYNTAFLFDANSLLIDHYHKMKLIPFGENLPFGPLNIYLSKVLKNVSFFAKGTRYTLFQVQNSHQPPQSFTFTSAICYEILFSGFVRNFLNKLPEQSEQPDFIINLTNDSWYGDTIEPYQHQYLAHWRALEFQKPIIRATNTGITSILYPDGSLSEQLYPFKKGVLNLKLFTPHKARVTLFQKYGFLLCLILMTGLFIFETLLQKLMQSNKS